MVRKTLQIKLLCVVVLFAVLGLVGIRAVASYLDSLTALQAVDPQLAAEKYARLLFLLGIANVLLACGAGGELGFLCYKTLRTEQFPPPGIWLLRSTHTRTGKEARCIALTGLVIAAAIVLCGLGLSAMMLSLARTPIFEPTGPFLEAASDQTSPLAAHSQSTT